MLIIDNPTMYDKIDNVTNSTVLSSIVVAKISEGNFQPPNIVINLYFQDITSFQPTDNGEYLCAFYDTNTSQWNSSGCEKPLFNTRLDRYECQCYHLTSFALIWLPQSAQSPSLPDGTRPQLDAQDKASIAFQALSIVCFLGIIIHGITVRILYPKKYTQSRHLLPLISCGITMILFIFFIALGLTVINRNVPTNTNIETSTQQLSRAVPSSTSSPISNISCLPTEHALMFIVYFLIIFMFCSKTSIGYYNYRHYVELYPPPSIIMLIITMSLSFLISVIFLAFAAGYNSNPSNEITGIYDGKICWFTSHVIHYFLTIPISLFLAINLAMFIPVVKHNISHARIKDEDLSQYNRRKKCIYILLSSALTQGFGWLFGIVIALGNANSAVALSWLFIIFNGLEGLWIILLYIVIEKEGINVNERDRDDMYRPSRDHEDDEPQIQFDDIRFDENRDPLTMMKSDSPRNSFANLPASQAHHRRYKPDNDDL
jgi:hypothetical protein